MRRTARFALAAFLAFAAAAPALAAPADLLARYAGDWQGSGKVTGAQPGNVACKLSLKPTSAAKLSFTGRCTFTGSAAPQSFTGSIAYNEARKRYEATSSAAGIVVGTPKGNGVTFVMDQKTIQGQVSSTFALSGGTIKIDFKITDPRSGDATAAHIAFAKS